MSNASIDYKTRSEIYGMFATAMLIFALLSSCQKSQLSREVESLKEDLANTRSPSYSSGDYDYSRDDADSESAYNDGYKAGFDEGSDFGYEAGYEDGYNAGYDEALNE